MAPEGTTNWCAAVPAIHRGWNECLFGGGQPVAAGVLGLPEELSDLPEVLSDLVVDGVDSISFGLLSAPPSDPLVDAVSAPAFWLRLSLR
jgi:hypothetical protein